jgi:hypothetical protein
MVEPREGKRGFSRALDVQGRQASLELLQRENNTLRLWSRSRPPRGAGARGTARDDNHGMSELVDRRCCCSIPCCGH